MDDVARMARLEQLWISVLHGLRTRLQQHPGAISQSRYIVLGLLASDGGCAVSTVAQHLDITVAAATGLVDRLVQAGWVRRSRDGDDRRIVRLHLTPVGEQVLADERARRRAVLEQLLGQLTAAEQKQLADLFERLLEMMDTHAYKQS